MRNELCRNHSYYYIRDFSCVFGGGYWYWMTKNKIDQEPEQRGHHSSAGIFPSTTLNLLLLHGS